jgi:hypothetical protein
MPPGAPSESPDPYVVLGVSRTATDAEIRAAYRALVAQYHPDRHQGNPLADLANARMAEINRAYETLSQRARDAGDNSSARGESTATSRRAGGAAPAASHRGGGRRGRPSRPQPLSKRLFRGALFLLALPFFLRMAPRLVRLAAGLGRIAFDGVVRIRGTPLVALGVLLATALLIIILVRRRSTVRRDK